MSIQLASLIAYGSRSKSSAESVGKIKFILVSMTLQKTVYTRHNCGFSFQPELLS